MRVRPGDRIGILALNSIAYLEAELATWAAQAVTVPMNIRWSIAENAYAVEDSDIRLPFVDRNFRAEADALRQKSEDLIIVGMDDMGAAGDETIEDMIASHERAPELDPDPAALAASSTRAERRVIPWASCCHTLQ